MVMRGSRLASGSWKTICRSLRAAAHRLALGVGDVAAQHGDRAGGGRDQVQHRARQGRLARAALADHAQGLALAHLEGDAVDGAQLPGLAEQALARPGTRPSRRRPSTTTGASAGTGVERRPAAAVGAVEARDRVQQGARVGGLRVRRRSRSAGPSST